jgi:hypothetical protein
MTSPILQDFFWNYHICHHDSLMKLHFIKSKNPNHVTFDNSYKLHKISCALITIYGYFWITFLRWSLVIWRTRQRVHGMLDNFLCLWIHPIHVSWITVANDILVELFKNYFASQSSPHMTSSLPMKYARNLRICHTLTRICNSQLAMNKK